MKQIYIIILPVLFLCITASTPVYTQEELVEKIEEDTGALSGFKVGINIGYPIITGEFLSTAKKYIYTGIIIATPFGVHLGPLNLGFNAEIISFSFGGGEGTELETDYSGFAFIGSVNTLLYKPYNGLLSMQVGGGYFGKGFGATAGISFEYPLNNIRPLLSIIGYARANATTEAGGAMESNAEKPTGWIEIGIILNYDIIDLLY